MFYALTTSLLACAQYQPWAALACVLAAARYLWSRPARLVRR